MQSVELHLHTTFSLLDGLNDSAEYMKRAKELGMTHMAITDHGTLSGHRAHQRAGKEAGIIPILGCEMYISATDRFDRRAIAKRDDNTSAYNHLTVLSQDETGLRNLNRLSEIAWTEGFYSKPRMDLEVLEEYSEGLIILSGCYGGLISEAILAGAEHQASMLTDQFKRIFGDRFFIEIQGHNPPELNAGLLALAKKYKVRPVVTSDCHYARKEDLWMEDAMLILSTQQKPVKGIDFEKSRQMDFIERYNYLYPERPLTFQEYEIFLRSYEEHRILLEKQGIGTEAIDNTLRVAEMIGEYPYYEGLDLLPKLDKGQDPNKVLWEMVLKGAAERGTLGVPEYDERRKVDMSIIEQKDMAIYFIIEAEAIQRGKAKGMMFGPGRGSGAGFLPNYELGITNVDPVKYGLLSFRFLDPGRDDEPDIDTDVQRSRRGEFKDDMTREHKHIASIATFGVFQGKSAIRAAARVFAIPLGEVNRAMKGADWPINFFEQFEASEKGAPFAKKYPEVMRLAKFMHGRLEKTGIHAGGLILSNQPINEYAPMQTAKDPNDDSAPRIPLVALDMNEIADIGFIKYDFLGLKALDIITGTLKDIKERHGKDIDLDKLPLDDPKVYESISTGYTKGVFQVEAVPYTSLVLKMGGLKNFDELVASNALVRPGAANSTAGAAFIARRKGEEPSQYFHPDMEAFTKDTYGTVIYQEQVMLTMTELAGMSMSDANKVRKIIGKKRDVKEFEAYKAKFVDGASKKVSKAVAEGLWHDFEAHAGYSFNKSHAVAYSMLSYWTAWLKLYYPIEFMKNVLAEEDENDYILDYLIEAKRLGLRIMLPNVNLSGINFEIQRDEKGEFIRFGLSNIKYISGKLAHRLEAIRPFNSYEELAEAVKKKGSGLNTRVLQALNAIGGAVFPDNPRRGDERSNFFEYLNIPAFETKEIPVTMREQFQPLDEYDENDAFVSMGMVRGIKTGDGWARLDIVDETGSQGVFTDEHTPIEKGNLYVFLIANNRVSRYVAIKDIPEGGDFVDFLAAESFPDIPDSMLRVVSFRTKKTKKGDRMADVVFSDNEKDLIGAVVFPQKFHEAFTKLRPGAVVDVKLSKTKDGNGFFVDRIL
jgi:DNA polymerase-3 subunit alpha